MLKKAWSKVRRRGNKSDNREESQRQTCSVMDRFSMVWSNYGKRDGRRSLRNVAGVTVRVTIVTVTVTSMVYAVAIKNRLVSTSTKCQIIAEILAQTSR